jgi:hypothetical protein
MSKTLLLGEHLVCSYEVKKCEDIKLTCIGFDLSCISLSTIGPE